MLCNKYKNGMHVVFTGKALSGSNKKDSFYPPIGTHGVIAKADGTSSPGIVWDNFTPSIQRDFGELGIGAFYSDSNWELVEPQTKFKVGDVVRFIDEAGRKDYPNLFPPVGTVGTVTKVEGLTMSEVYTVQWSPDIAKLLPIRSSFVFAKLLELVESGPNLSYDKILIMRDKKDPMRVIARDLGTNKTAEARCNPKDEFKYETGVRLALDRLLGTETTEKKDPPAKFKVGDVVIGNENASFYGVTKPGWIGYVVGVGPREGFISVMERENAIKFMVRGKCFDHYRPVFKKGDRVRMRDPGHFTCSERSLWATDRIMTVKEYLPASDAYLMEENSYAFAPLWLVKVPGWNGRITPVNANDLSRWWTNGKIYEVKDGVLRDDDGETRYYTDDKPVVDLAELQRRVPFKILEIKD